MKNANIFNLTKLKQFMDSAKATGFTDSSAGTILEQQFNHISPKILEMPFAGLTFRETGITVNNEGGYAATITSLRLTIEGDFKESGDNSENKGKITLSGDTSQITVKSFEAESDWSVTKIEEYKIQGRNLPQEHIKAHNEIYQRNIDKVGYLGTTSQAGLLNYAGFTADAAPGLISTLTSEEMYAEIAGLITDQRDAAGGVTAFECDTVVMPPSVMRVLNKTVYNSAAGSDTVMKALKDNFTDITWLTTTKAEDAGTAGASRVCAFNSNDESMVFRIPTPFFMSPVVQLGFKFHVETAFRIAGLDILEDLAGRYLEGL